MTVPWNISPWEIVNLLLIILLVPLTVGNVMKFRVRPKYMLWGYCIMAAAGVLSVLEHPFLPSEFITDVKYAVFALSAIFFAIGAWRLRALAQRREL